MLRAAPWELGRKQQKLRLLAKPLCLELQQWISTSIPRHSAAQNDAITPNDDQASHIPPTRLPKATLPNSNLHETATAHEISSEVSWLTSSGWEDVARDASRHGLPQKLTIRQSRLRRMRRRARKIINWESLHNHTERNSRTEAQFDTLTAGSSLPWHQHNSMTSISTERFADKFSARREGHVEGHEESAPKVFFDISLVTDSSQSKGRRQPKSRTVRTKTGYRKIIEPYHNVDLEQDSQHGVELDFTVLENPKLVVTENVEPDAKQEQPREVDGSAAESDQGDSLDDILDADTLEAVTKDMATGLTRSWEGHGPSWFIHSCVSGHPDQHQWRTRIANMRTVRPSIIALQLLIRRDALRSAKSDPQRSLLEHLPQGKARRQIIGKMAAIGLSRQSLSSASDVLEPASDEERCRRFLAQDGPKPIWLLNFLLRPGSTIQNPRTLSDLIVYCTTIYKGPQPRDLDFEIATYLNTTKRESPLVDIAPEDVAHLVLLLSMRAMVVDARLLPKIAELAAQYIERMDNIVKHPAEIFYDQCGLFNAALAAFRPSKQRLPYTWFRWIPAHWDAQKALLNMSTGLPKPLLVDKLGYRSVREVLSGLEKDHKEIHNSLRHRETWPPYLDPSDGIDEASEPDANWSRSVSAATLQQEAGFPLNEQDEVLDILQGRSPDTTPTIQQRLINTPHPDMQSWEASIKATRNVQEAWARFRSPPTPGMEPGPNEYGAMLAKLFTPIAGTDSTELPGDKALNHPGREDPNLTEFEKKRMQAPSAGRLRRQMIRKGIKPSSATLNMLISNNKRSRRTVKNVLQLSGLGKDRYLPLLASQTMGYKGLQKVPLSLFVAFIQHVSSLKPVSPQLLLRAMHMCEARFAHDEEAQPWAQHCWGRLLKACSRRPADPRPLATSLVSQINTYHYVMDAIEQGSLAKLPTVMQFASCAHNAAKRMLIVCYQDVENEEAYQRSPLKALYGHEGRRTSLEGRIAGIGTEHVPMLRSMWHLKTRLHGLIETLIDRERNVHTVLAGLWSGSLDDMRARADPVRAYEAQMLMWTWAFLGEYEEMARYLEWLVRQWDSQAIYEQLQYYGQPPRYAGFDTTLCIFRRYAEPMLPEERVGDLRRKIEEAQVVWEWPTAAKIDSEFRNVKIHSTRLLHVQQWTRYWQAKERREDMSTIMRPKRWADYGIVRRPWYDEAEPTQKANNAFRSSW